MSNSHVGLSVDQGWRTSYYCCFENAITGNFVCISHRNSSDGNDCDYIVRIEGRRVTCTYSCEQGGDNWSATIT